MKAILDAHDKLVYQTTNPLSRLMRTILAEMDIDSQQFNSLLNIYVKKETRDIPRTEKSSFKTNLVAALSSSKLQVLNFERFLKLLGPVTVKFTVTLEWRDGTKKDFDVDLDIVDTMKSGSKGGNSWDDDDDYEEED